jgi:hypothetical protein
MWLSLLIGIFFCLRRQIVLLRKRNLNKQNKKKKFLKKKDPKSDLRKLPPTG